MEKMKTDFIKTLEAFLGSLDYDDKALEEKKRIFSEYFREFFDSSITNTEDLTRGIEQRANSLKSTSERLKSSTDRVIKELEAWDP